MSNDHTLGADLGIDAAEIMQRQAFLSLEDHDRHALKALHDVLEPHRNHLSELFYQHLLRFPDIRPLLGDDAKLARLKQSQSNYFSQLTSGCYDQDYVENRLHIGVVHQRVGLTPKWYISAYCKYLGEVMPLILEHYSTDMDAALQVCRALTRVVFFDMGLALDTYFHTEHESLMQARRYTEQIVSNMPIGFIVLDVSGQMRLANQAVLMMFGLRDNEPWQQQSPGQLLGVPALDEKIDRVVSSGKNLVDYGFERDYGTSKRYFVADISLAQMGHEQLVMVMVQDVTIRRQSEEEVHRLAFYDPLTQLPNRSLFHERLRQCTAISSRTGNYGAVMFIDLDNFKALNDTRGHEVGDQLLQAVSSRLSSIVREGDTVARLGGDEFVVALESLHHDEHEAANLAEMIAEKIRNELSRPYQLNGIEHSSSPSIGVTLFSGHRNSIEEILKQADLAMYQAKSAGRNRVRFFDPSIQAELEQRIEMEKDLRASIRHEQLELHYQPQVNEAGMIIGAEALIRWKHPQRGMVSPAQFIPLAEEIGLIIPIGDWVIEQACMQLKRWEMDPAMRDLTLSINVSPRQLSNPWFVEQIREAIEKTGIRTSRLKLELTESFILHDIEDAIAKMMELRKTGIHFAMDDFGTGYSSLSYLNRLPLNQLKIDQSFIRNVMRDKNSRDMVRTIIDIARNFNLQTVAEGVETDDQLAFLRQYGCSQFQGYLFGKPVPVEQFELTCKSFHKAST